MRAYVIADTRQVDDEQFAKYRSLAADSIVHYGGRYVARGGAVDSVEGGWKPEAVVIVEFSSMERAREWYGSAEYAEALRHRAGVVGRRLIFVEGLDD